MTSPLAQLSESVMEAVAAASPSVVGVGPRGSGVVVGDGLVVTNAHNLRGGAEVTFADGRRVPAVVAGADIDGDLAVLQVATEGAPVLEWADRSPRLGQAVIGLSRPGGRALRAGVGFVSGLDLAFRGPEGRLVRGALEHTAPLAPGSSGGPVIDDEGHLVGVNTHRPSEGVYLAQPASEDLKARVQALSQGQAPQRVRLGVALAPPKVARRLRAAVGLPERQGLLVQDVDPAGPAGRAGVRQGDLIVAVGGNPVASVDELADALQARAEAGPLELMVVRGAEDVTLSVDFHPGPAATA
jgi:serine protease Do